MRGVNQVQPHFHAPSKPPDTIHSQPTLTFGSRPPRPSDLRAYRCHPSGLPPLNSRSDKVWSSLLPPRLSTTYGSVTLTLLYIRRKVFGSDLSDKIPIEIFTRGTGNPGIDILLIQKAHQRHRLKDETPPNHILHQVKEGSDTLPPTRGVVRGRLHH